MRAFDASSIIFAWDSYPFDQFPPLWKWIGRRIQDGDLVISEVALAETKAKYPECDKWLTGQSIEVLAMSEPVLLEAMRI